MVLMKVQPSEVVVLCLEKENDELPKYLKKGGWKEEQDCADMSPQQQMPSQSPQKCNGSPDSEFEILLSQILDEDASRIQKYVHVLCIAEISHSNLKAPSNQVDVKSHITCYRILQQKNHPV